MRYIFWRASKINAPCRGSARRFAHRRLRIERLEERRLLAAAGDLDPTFGGNGIVTTDFTSNNDFGRSMVLQPDGKIVVAGGSSSQIALARYNTDGSLDATFDGDGRQKVSLALLSLALGVALQPDGKIVVASHAQHNNEEYDFGAARFHADGSLDATFDGDGRVTTSFGGPNNVEQAKGIAVQADGKIVIAGYRHDFVTGDFALLRYNADGSLDLSFDGDGRVTTAFGANQTFGMSLAIQADGKIVAAGFTVNGGNRDFAVVRYNVDGSLDVTFDGDGMLTTAFGAGDDNATSVAIQPDGKIVVAGRSFNGTDYDVAVARYNDDGSLDATFDGDGLLTTAILAGNDEAMSIAFQADGKIIVAANSHNGANYDLALLRYNTDGSLDSTFNGDGMLTTVAGTGHDTSWGAAVQADGKIVLAGATVIGSNGEFVLARYEGNNSPTGPANVDLAPISEDVPLLSSPGTGVSAIVAASGAADLDGNSIGIAVTAADNDHGQWQYSTDSGGDWYDFSASTTSARLLAPQNMVRFVPHADYYSEFGQYPALSFKTWDQTSGTAGSTADTTSGSAFSATAALATQSVLAVNDEEVLATNAPMVIDRAAITTISAAFLETTDIDNAPGELTYTITAGPAHGTLLVNGLAATQFTQQDIDAGLVCFECESTDSFNDSFEFIVDDGQGTASTGTFHFAIGPYPGDYNRDRKVDVSDYLVWRKLLNTVVAPFSGADGDGNAVIDQADYDMWVAHFGETMPPAAGGGGGSTTAAAAELVEPTSIASAASFDEPVITSPLIGSASAEGDTSGDGSAGPLANLILDSVDFVDPLGSNIGTPVVRQKVGFGVAGEPSGIAIADAPSRRDGPAGSPIIETGTSPQLRDDGLLAWIGSRTTRDPHRDLGEDALEGDIRSSNVIQTEISDESLDVVFDWFAL